MEKMYMVFVHIRLIKICSTKWASCGKKATKIKETTMKTVQFIAKIKLVKTPHTLILKASFKLFIIWTQNKCKESRFRRIIFSLINIIILNKENCILFPRNLNLCFYVTPNQPIETVFFMNSKLCSEIPLMQEI